MTYETIVECEVLNEHLDDPDWVVVDCRFDIQLPDRCEREYRQAHISGAVYAHLDRDLSSRAIRGFTGRHPLPEPGAITRAFSGWGIGAGTQVVAYDESSGALAAARLWWLLKWAGHDAVAVLDGGWKAWGAKGLSYSTGVETRKPREFTGSFRPEMAMSAGQVLQVLGDHEWVVLDARSADRYQGRGETIDPVPGHIRGALSAPWQANVTEDGFLKPQVDLAARFEPLIGARPGSQVVVYCGSGVTAAHDALAMVRAGRGMPRLYPGSWSEWITDPSRPIVKGSEPG